MSPVTDADGDALFSRIDLSSRRTVLVGLSGGSDSTALLILLHDWLRLRRPDVALVAVTVDHGLRPDSAGEAERVAHFCAGHDITHQIRRWQGVKPGTGVAAAAREARYRLLAEAAADSGADLILTAHTAEDQAETVFMRQSRGEGGGLAGMAASTLYGGWCWIVRPLLQCRREALREFLRRRQLGWIEDPSNSDLRFERVRARRALQRDGEQVAALLQLAAMRARSRLELATECARIISSNAEPAGPGLLRLEPAFQQCSEIATQALRVLLACTGGCARLPGFVETRRLQAQLTRGRAVLARTLATPRRGGIYLHRELRDLPAQDVDGIFDFRYRIRPEASRQGWRLVRRQRSGHSLADAALAAQPVLVAPRQGMSEFPHIEPVLAPYDSFLAGFDLETARAAANLFGRRPYPASPLPESG